ncbi:MAG: alpha/beta fold hydrolase [Pseudomonadota bacterium]
MLNVIRTGPDTGRPLVIAHGLFGSARNWGVIAKRLAETRPVLTLDKRNHGESLWTDTHSYADLAGDLAGVIERETDGIADVLGHSMGGKAAMVLALSAPGRVGRLIVADIAPVAYEHTQLPYVVAMREMDLEGLRSRTEAHARLAERVDDEGIRAFLLQSLDLKAEPPRWKLNLETLAREMDEILGWPEIAGRFDGPVLMLSGAASDYVRPEHRAPIRALFPAARFAKIPGAGHWLHAEKPKEFVAAVEAFLTTQSAGSL